MDQLEKFEYDLNRSINMYDKENISADEFLEFVVLTIKQLKLLYSSDLMANGD